MTVLNYKGFQGSVSFEDGKLLIQVLHIDDFITTECDQASEATSSFRNLVDDYLETCKAVGKEPCRPFKGSFNVRISPELHRSAAMAAVAEDISLNAWIGIAIEERLNKDDERNQLVAEALFNRKDKLPARQEVSAYKNADMSAMGILHVKADIFSPERNLSGAENILVRRSNRFGAF